MLQQQCGKADKKLSPEQLRHAIKVEQLKRVEQAGLGLTIPETCKNLNGAAQQGLFD